MSFDSESLILVDENDQVLGYESKDRCHQGDGILHRAFSLFIFNQQGELLLQQRSQQKTLWPGYWSNSCCSHPRQGEEMAEAAHRRLLEELGLKTELQYLYRFSYQAPFEDIGSEHELCSVFIGRSEDQVQVNVNEIQAWRYISPEALDRELAEQPEKFTPWFKMEWARLNREFSGELKALNGRKA